MGTISVRKLAKELGISKQAIHKRMKQLPPEFQPEMVDGVYELTPAIADAIRDSKKKATTVNQTNIDEVDALNRQVSDLKKDKKQLYRQLDQYQKLLDQQQQLTLQANQQIQRLQLPQSSEQPRKSEELDLPEISPSPTEKIKKGVFKRIFGL